MADYSDFSKLVREIYPVVGMVAYGNGNYEIIREAKRKSKQPKPLREAIKVCSKRSLIRLMFLMQVTDVMFESMFTATYPKMYPKDGKIVHDDINALANKFRRYGLRYIWFLEFQERGAPHIHWLLDVVGITPQMRVDIGFYWTNRIAQADWFGKLVSGEDSYQKEVMKMVRFNTHWKAWERLKDRDSAKKYVMKYASKEIQKQVPKSFRNVGRFWGSTRGLKPKGVEFDATEDDVEAWLVEKDHPMAQKMLVPKYVWQVGEVTYTQASLCDGESSTL